MNKTLTLLAALFFGPVASAQIGIGTTSPNSSAILDLTASGKGVLFPRMASALRTGISTPANGLVVYDTDSSSLFIYDQISVSWKKIMPINSLNSLVTGTSVGDVLTWNGTKWVATPKCNLFTYLFRDKDGDGKGDRFSPLLACGPFPGFVADSTDCDDNNALIGSTTWYRDADGDGFGDPNSTKVSCTQPAGYVSNNTDCDDTNAAINLNTADIPDDGFTDTNCDGIDGKETDAIFVAVTGNDANAGTRALPVKTIGAGITKAAAGSKSQVLVSSGQYNETVTMQSGISIYGGYSAANNWVRSAVYKDTINSVVSSGFYVGVIASSITTNTTIDRFVIFSPNAAGTTNIAAPTVLANSSYGIYSSGSSNLLIKNNTIIAGNGAAGTTANTGASGTNGVNGAAGAPGDCDNNVSAIGGIGGTSSCSQPGGKGGAGGFSNTLFAAAGTPGTGPAPGSAGIAGLVGDPGTNGGPGGNGGNGSGGSGGAGAVINTGTINTGIWAGNAGGTGGTASAGSGGGGGGGGGGQHCTFCQDGTGNGGGGGGGGACGGGGGLGGIAGGGSIGIFFTATGIGNQVINNNIITANGGTGGTGGVGGAGGTGGSSGIGGTTCTSSVGAGGNGGHGGNGGQAGGGGGGAGGISFGIFYNTGATVTVSGTAFTIGSGGFGGTGGAGAATGSTGINGASGSVGTP